MTQSDYVSPTSDDPTSQRWQGSVALVTGASSGAGLACARALAGLGAHVVVACTNPDGQAVADELDGLFVQLDVGDYGSWAVAVDEVHDRWGRLDTLLLNAGVMTRPRGAPSDDDPLSTITVDSYRRVRRANVDGVVFGVIATNAIETGRAGRHIVVTSSVSGLEPTPNDPLYGMTKHASIGFVRSLGPILARQDMSIQAICPIGIDTPMVGPDLRIPGRSFAPPSDVARAVVQVIDEGTSGDVWIAQGIGEPYRRHEFAPAR
jgi:NAD(P)-dependent dehydrogenase (short-subunit alcohol dehydrogenase family)